MYTSLHYHLYKLTKYIYFLLLGAVMQSKVTDYFMITHDIQDTYKNIPV